jgi:acyl carrier protein
MVNIGGASVSGDAVAGKVRAYIEENLLLNSDDTFSNNWSLIESGILDSTGAMDLIAFLEHEFAIAFSDEDMVPENLDSVDQICSFINLRLSNS